MKDAQKDRQIDNRLEISKCQPVYAVNTEMHPFCISLFQTLSINCQKCHLIRRYGHTNDLLVTITITITPRVLQFYFFFRTEVPAISEKKNSLGVLVFPMGGVNIGVDSENSNSILNGVNIVRV